MGDDAEMTVQQQHPVNNELRGNQSSHNKQPQTDIHNQDMTSSFESDQQVLGGFPTMGNLIPGKRTGKVKFFNSQKGFGFIIPDDPNEVNVNGIHESKFLGDDCRLILSFCSSYCDIQWRRFQEVSFDTEHLI
jgi:hypothetical protein